MEQDFWDLSNLFFEINSNVLQLEIATGYMNRYTLALSIRLVDIAQAISILKELIIEVAEVVDVSHLAILNSDNGRCN